MYGAGWNSTRTGFYHSTGLGIATRRTEVAEQRRGRRKEGLGPAPGRGEGMDTGEGGASAWVQITKEMMCGMASLSGNESDVWEPLLPQKPRR